MPVVPGEQAQGKASALPEVHPSAFCHVNVCLLMPGEYTALQKALPEAKQFARGCGTGPSAGTLRSSSRSLARDGHPEGIGHITLLALRNKDVLSQKVVKDIYG